MRGVTCRLHCLHQQCRISTHTPHARRDVFLYSYIAGDDLFQLTRLMRGVTADTFDELACSGFQLTRLMRGVTEAYDIKCSVVDISTHTPHARRDCISSLRRSKDN